MLDRLGNPTLLDFLYVAHLLGAEQKVQYLALTGREYNPEENAAEMFTALGPRWVYPGDDGRPICIGGFRMLNPGTWQDWLMVVEGGWEDHAKSITRVCQATIELMLSTEARRVQALCMSDRTKVRDWYRLIGYTHEGTLRAFGANGENFEMYARVK